MNASGSMSVASPENDHAYPPLLGVSGAGAGGVSDPILPLLTLLPVAEPDSAAEPVAVPAVTLVPLMGPARIVLSAKPITVPVLLLAFALTPKSAGLPITLPMTCVAA